MSARMDPPEQDTYTERVLQACGHWQTWEQFKGLPMEHDPSEVCWDCRPCPDCGRKKSEGIHDPFGECVP